MVGLINLIARALGENLRVVVPSDVDSLKDLDKTCPYGASANVLDSWD